MIVHSNLGQPTAGELAVELPSGWTAKGPLDFHIERGGGSVARSVRLVPTEQPAPGRYEIGFQAVLETGRISGSVPLVEYPHVRPRPVPRLARLEMSVFDLALPEVREVGYVLGAADRVPAVLDSLGIPTTILSGQDLSLGDLGRFDVIVVGSRAYETDRELRESNGRLLDYVAAGGTLLVQYQQYQFIEGGYAPFPLEIGRPHGRVTDETAPVRLLDIRHPALRRPNRITPADWSGWVQERGLYFPGSWDERYQPLLAMSDPGRDEERGALLVAEYGEGTYIYSGLSFFRQLPAGVPGAIRLFANLLAATRGE